MKVLYSILISLFSLVTIGLSSGYEDASAYRYAYGYKKFEECEMIDFTDMPYKVVYYKILGDSTEKVIMLNDEGDYWKIPETNKYIFYTYSEEGEMIFLTRSVGVFRELPFEESDENDERGIILL